MTNQTKYGKPFAYKCASCGKEEARSVPCRGITCNGCGKLMLRNPIKDYQHK